MKKNQTDEEIFLAWCKEHNIKFRKTVSPATDEHEKRVTYNINPDHKATIHVQGQVLKMNRQQECDAITIYFYGDHWSGGTNTIWNTNLPWMRR